MSIYKFCCTDNLSNHNLLGSIVKLEITVEASNLEDAKNRAIFFHPINWVLVCVIS